MCDTCGCQEENNKYGIKFPGDKTHDEEAVHDHEHEHDHHHHAKKIRLEKDILSSNNLLAERVRGYFESRKIFAINMVSSPGSGKTSVIKATIEELKNKIKIYVIEGDQQGTLDADIIKQAGAEVIQINTGDGCHLSAEMVYDALKRIDPQTGSLVIIENVGNLVCPAMFDLGESKRVVVSSVSEGDNKPIKYPNMFLSSDLCLLNKMDLLKYCDFDLSLFKENIRRVNHNLEIIELSVRGNSNLKAWFDWLLQNIIS